MACDRCKQYISPVKMHGYCLCEECGEEFENFLHIHWSLYRNGISKSTIRRMFRDFLETRKGLYVNNDKYLKVLLLIERYKHMKV